MMAWLVRIPKILRQLIVALPSFFFLRIFGARRIICSSCSASIFIPSKFCFRRKPINSSSASRRFWDYSSWASARIAVTRVLFLIISYCPSFGLLFDFDSSLLSVRTLKRVYPGIFERSIHTYPISLVTLRPKF